MPLLIYYRKADCPLCEKGRPIVEAVAARFGYAIESVDITRDRDLIRRFGEKIPVLECDGVVLGWGLLSKRALERKLLATHRAD
jgi:hypothetical protein